MTNLTGDGVGRYPDQAWAGDKPLKEVLSKDKLDDNSFFVDRTNKRLYITTKTANRPDIETSRPDSGDRDRFVQVLSTNVTIEGIKLTRFSPNADDYGVLVVQNVADNFLLKDSEISHLPYDGVTFAQSNNSTLKNVTVEYVGWQSVSANQTDNAILDGVKITNADFFDEFTSSPASGALKTSRTRDTKVLNSLIANNKTHGLWFDQSNIDVVVYNNVIRENTGAAVFFEISDGLLMVNNYLVNNSSQLRMSGSSGLKVINNTIVGGTNPIAVYTDDRSQPGCAQNKNNCDPRTQTWSSDRQGRFGNSPTMDWMPRIDYMINNIVANPTGKYICSQATTFCVSTFHNNTGASAPIETIFHNADVSRGIPQTFINSNIYANGNGSILNITQPNANYTNINALTAGLKTATGLADLDSKSLYGNSYVNSDGTPTAELSNKHSNATAIPIDAEINKYLPAGTKYYGVLATSTSSSGPENPGTITPNPEPPVGPSTLDLKVLSDTEIELSWPPSDKPNDLKDYLVYRNNKLVKEGLATTIYIDKGLTAETNYRYQVKIRNKDNQISAGSPQLEAKTLPKPSAPNPTIPETPKDTTRPTAPSGIRKNLSLSWSKRRYTLKLTWNPSMDDSGIKEYRILRNGSTIGTSGSNSFTDSTLNAGQLYTYNIYALDNAKPSNISDPGTISAKVNCFLIWCSLEQ